MRFVIAKSSDGQFYWYLRGANGEIMCQSETMKAKQSCQTAIASVKASAGTAQVIDITETKA